MPPWLQILLLAGPVLLWAAGAAIRLFRLQRAAGFTVTHLPVTGRTIRANWSLDTDPIYWESKAEVNQLVKAMADEMALEIDREVCRDLFDPLPTARPPLQIDEDRQLTVQRTKETK